MTPNAEFIFQTQQQLPSGQCTWKAPSNIALIKYWGKRDLQLPQNPSLSFTLSACATQTELRYTPKTTPSEAIAFEVALDGAPAPSFRPKIAAFFKRIAEYVPFIKDYTFTINTSNSFPHSSGIASSASGMAALAMCIMDLEKQLNPNIMPTYFHQKASFLARLGSGSAARSIAGPITIWGVHQAIPKSTNAYAVPADFKVHKNFAHYQDTILIVDKGQKQVSSSVGHNLMHNHPYAKQRFNQAEEQLADLVECLKTGDLEHFIKLTESEALTLHAMMMTSAPYYILMRPNTLKIIEAIWLYRETTKSKLCFTLDAGANVHLLYPNQEKKTVRQFINETLRPYCDQGHYIHDQMGSGVEKIR